LVDATVDRFGQVDICVIGPGAGWHPEPVSKLDSSAALDDIRQEVAPIYHLMPLVLPGMFERGWGRLIAIALAQPHSSPSYSYDVGKAARVYAIQHARDAVWRNRVTVNLIGPGAVPEIGSLEEAIEQCDHGPAWKNRTTATPQDIAEGVTFLCSESGRFVSGSVLTYMMA
jgi:3-oxoacyl-[acyl-carrier protein] reductase